MLPCLGFDRSTKYSALMSQVMLCPDVKGKVRSMADANLHDFIVSIKVTTDLLSDIASQWSCSSSSAPAKLPVSRLQVCCGMPGAFYSHKTGIKRLQISLLIQSLQSQANAKCCGMTTLLFCSASAHRLCAGDACQSACMKTSLSAPVTLLIMRLDLNTESNTLPDRECFHARNTVHVVG